MKYKNIRIILSIILLLFVGVFLSLFFSKSLGTSVMYTTTTPKDVDWEKSLPNLQRYLHSHYKGIRLGEDFPMKVYAVGDITGDGLSEAIIDSGVEGSGKGTSLDRSTFMYLVGVQDGTFTLLNISVPQGVPISEEYVVGLDPYSHKVTDLVFVPEKKAFYESIKRTDSSTFCSDEAYQWNPQTRLFDFSQTLSDEIKVNLCK